METLVLELDAKIVMDTVSSSPTLHNSIFGDFISVCK